ncbi:MAG: hypothetical protein WKF34_08910 [Pyrinomonadaceae bacterium]
MRLFDLNIFALISILLISGCRSSQQDIPAVEPTPGAFAAPSSPVPTPSPILPNLQSEILDNRNRATTSPIGAFDFRNHTYELPRGWQNPDGTADITLVNGRVPRVDRNIREEMDDAEKAEARAERRIGMSYVTTKYLDATGDGVDEAVVILKVETGGAAIPQIVHIFAWRDSKPEIIWPFRTGDRADGGLKDIRAENGELVIELYGQDRFLLGQTETGKITGDEEQLCCPTYFTRTYYRWNGNAFLLTRKRLTFSINDPRAPAQENLGDKMNAVEKSKK